ncbi:hypothetical protein GWK47_023140 [Chionoecetes opilio]|uniref:Uncharacterized protein n=1 Tax=Chionoecetes opilio TaxID=41210 RepID=A0A8J4XMJ6_CHIOP|nr:hypothetical protein GWK47_023140 [Chionoecetes opilio]
MVCPDGGYGGGAHVRPVGRGSGTEPPCGGTAPVWRYRPLCRAARTSGGPDHRRRGGGAAARIRGEHSGLLSPGPGLPQKEPSPGRLWEHDHEGQGRRSAPARVERSRPGGGGEGSEHPAEVGDSCEVQAESEDGERAWLGRAVACWTAAGRSGGRQDVGAAR